MTVTDESRAAVGVDQHSQDFVGIEMFSVFQIPRRDIYISGIGATACKERHTMLLGRHAATCVLAYVALLVANVSGITIPAEPCAAKTESCVCKTETGAPLDVWRNTTCNQCVLL